MIKLTTPARTAVPSSYFRWASKLFWALWRIVAPFVFFEGVDSPLMFTALFLVSEWMTGYYLAFNFQVRKGSGGQEKTFSR